MHTGHSQLGTAPTTPTGAADTVLHVPKHHRRELMQGIRGAAANQASVGLPRPDLQHFTAACGDGGTNRSPCPGCSGARRFGSKSPNGSQVRRPDNDMHDRRTSRVFPPSTAHASPRPDKTGRNAGARRRKSRRRICHECHCGNLCSQIDHAERCSDFKATNRRCISAKGLTHPTTQLAGAPPDRFAARRSRRALNA